MNCTHETNVCPADEDPEPSFKAPSRSSTYADLPIPSSFSESFVFSPLKPLKKAQGVQSFGYSPGTPFIKKAQAAHAVQDEQLPTGPDPFENCLPPDFAKLGQRFRASRQKVRERPSGQDSSPHMTSFEEQQFKVVQGLVSQMGDVPLKSRSTAPKRKSSRARDTQANVTADSNASFNLANDGSAAAPPPMRRFTRNSTESINTRFVADDSSNGPWQFNAGSPTGKSAASPTMRRAQSGGRLSGRRSPAKDKRRVPPIPSPSFDGATADEPTKGGFDANEWQEKLGDLHFGPPPAPPRMTSPIRPIRRATKPKPVLRTAGTAGLVDDEETTTSGEDKSDRPAVPPMSGPAVGSPSAMDIDPPTAPTAPTTTLPNEARNINVEPSRADWRAGDLNGKKPEVPPRPPKQPQPSFSTDNGVGSEDTDEFHANMADWKNIEPFAPTGLSSFGDLKMSLPFESKASAKMAAIPKPAAAPAPRMTIDFPRPPLAPRPPPTLAVPGITPTAGAWDKYVQAFNDYMTQWHSFNNRYIDHFRAREEEIAKLAKRSGHAWLSARSDAGIVEYLGWVTMDQEARAEWGKACAQHEQNIREYMKYRERMLMTMS